MQKIAALVAFTILAGYLAARGLELHAPRADAAAAQVPASASSSLPTGMLVVPEDGRGHFIAEPLVNGIRIQAVVDTGASVVALSAEDAARCGIFPKALEFRQGISTANGTVMAAPVRLREVRVGGIVMRDVEAVVLPAGRLKGTLLGMSFLRRLTSFQISGGSLILKQ